MLVTLSGIAMLVRLIQPENAPQPMVVTLSGIFTFVRLRQFSNASPPILVTPSETTAERTGVSSSHGKVFTSS